jgi:hypothetical protein
MENEFNKNTETCLNEHNQRKTNLVRRPQFSGGGGRRFKSSHSDQQSDADMRRRRPESEIVGDGNERGQIGKISAAHC